MLPPEAFRGVVASFLEVFPQSTLWYNTAELLLVGVRGERFELDPRRIERLQADERIRDDLSYRHWGGPDRALSVPHMLLGCFLCGPRGLAALAAGAPRFHDDRPALDYRTSGLRHEGGHELSCLELLRSRIESPAVIAPGAFPPESLSAMRAVQLRNLGQIVSNRLLEPVWSAPSKASQQAVIERALAANPENSKANGLMGDALTEENRLGEALRFYRRAVELRPEDAIAQFELAKALARTGRDAEAIVYYRAAVEGQGGGADALYLLGVSLNRSGDVAAAIHAFQEALRVDPGHRQARQSLADLGAAAPAGGE
jgi:tetratricopeptide (TPR) repeat protein